MKHANIKLNVLILAVFLAFNPLEFNQAQYKSSERIPESDRTRSYNLYDNSSNSTISDASDHKYFRGNRFDKDFLDEYKKKRYSRKDDFIEDRNKRIDERRFNERVENNRIERETKTDNYFHVDRTGRTLWDGKHWEITDFPLRIYVKESSSKYYKPMYEDYVKYAMDVWRKADDRISYTFVNSRREADISLYFIEDLGDKYEENYLGLTEYDMHRGKIIDYSKIQISLIKFGNEIVCDGEIKATIIHEFGHALGLGHSENKNDIMYPFIDPGHIASMNFNELSKGDKEAIVDVISLGDEEIYVRK
ncbi:MAG: matrixin family metalloprotease [Ignavibacteria bacterium]|jgi:hypothetical protein